MNQKSKVVAIILAFFLGCWGAHQFYVGNKKKGVIMLIIGIVGLFLVTGIIALVDMIKFIMMSEDEFQRQCGVVKNNIYHTTPSFSENNFHSHPSQPSGEEPKEFTFCIECGTKIVNGSKFCPLCGAAQ